MSGQNKKLFVLIFIFVAVLVFPFYSFAQTLPIKSSAVTIVGTGIATDSAEPPPACEEPPCEEPPPPSGDIDQALLNDFSVRLSFGGPGFCLWSSSWRDPNAPGENISEDTKRKIYAAIALPAASARFLNIIKEKTITLEFYQGEHIRGCANGNKIQFMNFEDYVRSKGERGPGFLIVHEFGHKIGGRSNLDNLFPHDVLKRSSTDSDCYDDGFLKSYGLRRRELSPKRESFAEAIALYIYNSKKGFLPHTDIDDFRNECPATHEWIGNNVFRD